MTKPAELILDEIAELEIQIDELTKQYHLALLEGRSDMVIGGKRYDVEEIKTIGEKYVRENYVRRWMKRVPVLVVEEAK